MTSGELAELYTSHARRARALAYLLTGDQALAEDLVQDCFLRLCSRLRPVGTDELGAYLRRMVINACASHFRHQAVRRRRARDEAQVLGADSDLTADGADDTARRDELRAALLALPARQRSAVVLRHWLDLSETETAREMGCSVGTVKSLAAHGRVALRARLNIEQEWSR